MTGRACSFVGVNDYASFDDKRVKHLELIQGVITRLGNDGFLVKGWTLTIVGAIIGLAVNSKSGDLALVALVPSLAFWGLDAYFLSAERRYRALYDLVARQSPDVDPFFMSATSATFLARLPAGGRDSGWRCTLWRPVLRTFYIALVAATLVVAFILTQTGDAGSLASGGRQPSRMRSATSAFSVSFIGRPGGQMLPNPSRDQRGTT